MSAYFYWGTGDDWCRAAKKWVGISVEEILKVMLEAYCACYWVNAKLGRDNIYDGLTCVLGS